MAWLQQIISCYSCPICYTIQHSLIFILMAQKCQDNLNSHFFLWWTLFFLLFIYLFFAIYWLRCLTVRMKYLDEKHPVEGSFHTAQRSTWMPWQGEGERRRGRPSVSLSSSVSLGILSLWGQSLSKRCHYIPQPWQRAAVFSESCHLPPSGGTGWVGVCIVLDVTRDLKCEF